MAKKVNLKTPLFGNRRSHAMNATRHAQKPNTQKVTLANGETVKLPASVIRTLNKASKTNK